MNQVVATNPSILPRSSIAIFLVLSLISTGNLNAAWNPLKDKKDKNSGGSVEVENTLNRFRKSEGLSMFFEKAEGYAVFPSIKKVGIGLGGAFGKGQVFQDNKLIGDTSVKQVSIGFQLGGQAFSQIMFFKEKRDLERFTNGNFDRLNFPILDSVLRNQDDKSTIEHIINKRAFEQAKGVMQSQVFDLCDEDVTPTGALMNLDPLREAVYKEHPAREKGMECYRNKVFVDNSLLWSTLGCMAITMNPAGVITGPICSAGLIMKSYDDFQKAQDFMNFANKCIQQTNPNCSEANVLDSVKAYNDSKDASEMELYLSGFFASELVDAVKAIRLASKSGDIVDTLKSIEDLKKSNAFTKKQLEEIDGKLTQHKGKKSLTEEEYKALKSELQEIVDDAKSGIRQKEIEILRKTMPGISNETAEMLLKRHPCLQK